MRLYKSGSDMILFCINDPYFATFRIVTAVLLMTPAFCHVTRRQTSGLTSQRHVDEELNHRPVFCCVCNNKVLTPPQI